MWQLFGLFLLAYHACACDRETGPAGLTECLKLSTYDRSQWATCLTDAYIKTKSLQRHHCLDRSTTYCSYQCMIEVHNNETGSVTDDCYCKLSQTTVYPPTTALPSKCYSPSGESCDWYKDCLERKYPCENTDTPYAITYAEKFCSLYNQRLSYFSEKGQKWVNAVRKCLQVALVPFLRPWKDTTCSEIRNEAFASHDPCYLNPDKDAPSVCDLEISQFFQIFWTIKGSFIMYDTVMESLKGMWNVASRCTIKWSSLWIQKTVKRYIKILKIVVQKLPTRTRSSSEPNFEPDASNRFSYRLGLAIASALAWNKDAMDWFVYPGNLTAANSTDDDMYIALADKKALGIVNNTDPNIPQVDLNSTVRTLASAITQGKLPLQVDGNNVWLKTMASCSDQSCNQAQTLAVSEKPPKWHSSANQLLANVLKMFGVAVAALMLTNDP